MEAGLCRIGSVALIALGLAGCGAIRAHQQQEAAKQAIEAAKQVCQSLYADPALDRIRAKVALDDAIGETFETRTNIEHVLTEEKPVIWLWANARHQCHSALESSLTTQPIQINALVQAAWAA